MKKCKAKQCKEESEPLHGFWFVRQKKKAYFQQMESKME